MSCRVKQPPALVATLLWIGFVSAISFMEAWLKFQAPNVTLTIGLGIGRLVFGMLNKVEWVLALVALVSILLGKKPRLAGSDSWLLIAILILATQTIWLLPALDTRAELLIAGKKVPASNLHFYYVGLEVIKVIFLSLFARLQFEKNNRNATKVNKHGKSE